jgi:hypothetical protein
MRNKVENNARVQIKRKTLLKCRLQSTLLLHFGFVRSNYYIYLSFLFPMISLSRPESLNMNSNDIINRTRSTAISRALIVVISFWTLSLFLSFFYFNCRNWSMLGWEALAHTTLCCSENTAASFASRSFLFRFRAHLLCVHFFLLRNSSHWFAASSVSPRPTQTHTAHLYQLA